MVGKRLNQEVPEVEVQQRDLSTLSELDMSTLDPAFVYRFVHKSNLKIARRKAQGYVIVDPASEEIRNAVGESPEAEDGTYTIGDTVLMKCAKNVHRARAHHKKRKGDARLKGQVKKFKRTAQSVSQQRGLAVEIITDKGD